MKRFRFTLEKALRWRRMQAELEEARLAELLGRRERLRRESATLERELAGGEQALSAAARRGAAVEPQELAALEEFRRYVRRRREELRRAETELEWRIGERRKAVLEARRAVRILEKFRAKKFAEWSREADREESRIADELHLLRRTGSGGGAFRIEG